jgi:hypothetical protein
MQRQPRLDRPNGSWAITHNGGFLGYAQSRDEATAIGQSLVDWLSEHCRSAELTMDRPKMLSIRSFNPKR